VQSTKKESPCGAQSNSPSPVGFQLFVEKAVPFVDILCSAPFVDEKQPFVAVYVAKKSRFAVVQRS